MPARVKLKDTWQPVQCWSPWTARVHKCAWLAATFRNSLACLSKFSGLQPASGSLSLWGGGESGRRLVAGGIVLLTCQSLLVPAHPLGDPMQVLLVTGQMRVQPWTGACILLGSWPGSCVPPLSLPVCIALCHLNSVSSSGDEATWLFRNVMDNVLVITEGEEKGGPRVQSLMPLWEPNTKMRQFCPKYVCLLSVTWDHNIKPCKQQKCYNLLRLAPFNAELALG